MNKKLEEIREAVEWYIEQIDHNTILIYQDCEEQHHTPIPAKLLGQLKAYEEVRGYLTDLLKLIDE